MGQVTAAVVKGSLRIGLPLLVLGLCLALLSQKLAMADLAALPGQLRNITAVQWMMAAGLTLASFCAVGQYDALAHRSLGTGIKDHQARLTGTIGIALGQTLGFGMVTGAMARWRMLPGLSVTDALRLSTYVSLSFILAWIAVTSLICLVFPAPGWTLWPALCAVGLIPPTLWLLFRNPVFNWRGRAFRLPSLTLAGAFIFWAALDTTFAAAAFYVFVPDAGLSFLTFLPLFLIALGAALVSNTPGGVGPFELVLLTALPQTAPEALMTAILAYRLIYYALPASFAMLALLRPFPRPAARSTKLANDHTIGPRSEVAAILQNGGTIQGTSRSRLAFWPTGQTQTLFADPVIGSSGAALQHLSTSAHGAVRIPFIYKCSGRLAATARADGWSVLHIADDAIVDLAAYDHDVPARRRLRRKLRNLEKAQVHILCNPRASYAAMADVDATWQAAHGPARGGSMGRFCEAYIRNQWRVCAYRNGALIAFVTVHVGASDWCLDIMRHVEDIPDGTMHGLVDAAILAARAAGVQQFCLAATPACPNPAGAFWRWAARQAVARAGGPGLRQFKSAFAPRWSARYAAAPNALQLALGLADITQEIVRPRAIPRTKSNATHNFDENYELDSRRSA